MDFYEKLIGLCKQKGVSRSKMADDIGISRSAPQGWAERNSAPRFSTIKMIADYFGVPVSYFSEDDEQGKHSSQTTSDGTPPEGMTRVTIHGRDGQTEYADFTQEQMELIRAMIERKKQKD